MSAISTTGANAVATLASGADSGETLVLATMASEEVGGLTVLVRTRTTGPAEAIIASGFTRVGNVAVSAILEAVSNDAGQVLARVRLDNGALDIVSWDARRGIERVANGQFASIFGATRPGYAYVTVPTTADGRFVVSVGSATCQVPCAVQGAYLVRVAACSDIDFDNDGIFPSDDDLVRFLGVLAGEACGACDSIDFNSDGLFPDDDDLLDYLAALAGRVGCG